MSRYIERSDGMLRMLKVNYNSSQDNFSNFSWTPVLKIFTSLKDKEIKKISKKSDDVLKYMLLDRENPNSVQNIVVHSRENARAVQDHITIEVWQCLNDFYHIVRDPRHVEDLKSGDALAVIDTFVKQCLIFYGTVDITMARGRGYCFMSLGKFLERAMQSVDILDVKLGNLSPEVNMTTDTLYWKYMLMSISGYKLYLKNYQSGFESRNVVHQIVLNTQFPRSVLYSLIHLQRNFEQLKNYLGKEGYEHIRFMIGKLRSKVEYTTIDDIEEAGLHHYLADVKKDLGEISTMLNKFYFTFN